jgi:hypothetical protein
MCLFMRYAVVLHLLHTTFNSQLSNLNSQLTHLLSTTFTCSPSTHLFGSFRKMHDLENKKNQIIMCLVLHSGPLDETHESTTERVRLRLGS